MTSTRHKICKLIFWGLILVLLLFLWGCVKQPDSVDTAANAAHQQIVAIKESLPKECQNKANDEQLKALDGTIESIVANCNTQKAIIDEQRIRWKYAFLILSITVLAYFGRKALK